MIDIVKPGKAVKRHFAKGSQVFLDDCHVLCTAFLSTLPINPDMAILNKPHPSEAVGAAVVAMSALLASPSCHCQPSVATTSFLGNVGGVGIVPNGSGNASLYAECLEYDSNTRTYDIYLSDTAANLRLYNVQGQPSGFALGSAGITTNSSSTIEPQNVTVSVSGSVPVGNYVLAVTGGSSVNPGHGLPSCYYSGPSGAYPPPVNNVPPGGINIGPYSGEIYAYVDAVASITPLTNYAIYITGSEATYLQYGESANYRSNPVENSLIESDTQAAQVLVNGNDSPNPSCSGKGSSGTVVTLRSALRASRVAVMTCLTISLRGYSHECRSQQILG